MEKALIFFMRKLLDMTFKRRATILAENIFSQEGNLEKARQVLIKLFFHDYRLFYWLDV